jgi:phage terminase large subunit GpA-like protein
MSFIDSGDGYNSMDAVLVFCSGYAHINFYAIKGQKIISRGKNEKKDDGDDIGTGFKRYRASKSGGQYDFFLINTQHYKTQAYRNFKIVDENMTGSCLFPADYPDYYFEMFTSEELVKKNGVLVYDKLNGRNNEAIDCRVYALCAADVWVERQFVPSQQQWYKDEAAKKKQMLTPAQIMKRDKAFCISGLHAHLWGAA